MKTIKVLWFALFLGAIFSCNNLFAADEDLDASITFKVVYEKQDSIKYTELIASLGKRPKEVSPAIWIAQQLMGAPYVPNTLEIKDPEALVINLREFDCFTFVDVITAINHCLCAGHSTFKNFCNSLFNQRYFLRKQALTYTHRTHYITQWVINNKFNGHIHEYRVEDNIKKLTPLFSATQTIDLHYMTSHPEEYKMLKKHPNFIKELKDIENYHRGIKVKYIPKKLLNKSQEELKVLGEGDVIAIVTNKDGLDVSHVGFVTWKEGKPYLVHASSRQKKVCIEKQPLYKYLKRDKSNLGIRVMTVM